MVTPINTLGLNFPPLYNQNSSMSEDRFLLDTSQYGSFSPFSPAAGGKHVEVSKGGPTSTISRQLRSAWAATMVE